MFDSLEELQRTIDAVFDRITGRVKTEKTRIDAIGRRLQIAEAKIKHIQGTTKATTVLSPAKYPAPDRLNDFPLLFTDLEPQKPPKRSQYHLHDVPHVLFL